MSSIVEQCEDKARYFIQLNDYEKALKFLLKARAIEPDNTTINQLLKIVNDEIEKSIFLSLPLVMDREPCNINKGNA